MHCSGPVMSRFSSSSVSLHQTLLSHSLTPSLTPSLTHSLTHSLPHQPLAPLEYRAGIRNLSLPSDAKAEAETRPLTDHHDTAITLTLTHSARPQYNRKATAPPVHATAISFSLDLYLVLDFYLEEEITLGQAHPCGRDTLHPAIRARGE
jgi:hypothetical protein